MFRVPQIRGRGPRGPNHGRVFGNSMGMYAAAPRYVMFAGTANCTQARTVDINRLSNC